MTWEWAVVILGILATGGLLAYVFSGPRHNSLVGTLLEALDKREHLCLMVMEQSHKRQQELTDDLYIQKLLQQRGGGLIVMSPEDYLEQQVRTVMENFHIDRVAAIRYILSNSMKLEETADASR